MFSYLTDLKVEIMNLEKMLKDAYMSGVTEAQVAEQIPNMKFNFEGMSNAYAQSKVKELNIPDVMASAFDCLKNIGYIRN